MKKVLAVAVLLASAAAHGWHAPGHDLSVRLAVQRLGDDAPPLFSEGAEQIARTSLDPDLHRPRALPQLRAAEAPEHYFDLELLEGADLPPTRPGFLALCAERGLDSAKVGVLPYAVAEWTQRLAVALAEHRRWPENEHIRAKCLVYAGLMSHYAGDLCQPLHTTIHFDGMVGEEGVSPRTGIHAKSDALLHKVDGPERVAEEASPLAFDDLWAGVLACLEASHALVPRVYAIEAELPALEDPLPAGTEAARFAEERLAATVEFLGSLYLTAWKLSGEIELPAWHTR